MITLQEYANKINDLLAQGYGLLPVIYNCNCDGYVEPDDYYEIKNLPCEFKVDDLSAYFLTKSSIQTKENINCILIN